jgi:hypothetical protein
MNRSPFKKIMTAETSGLRVRSSGGSANDRLNRREKSIA